jgi:CheY-like chemotaxis protein
MTPAMRDRFLPRFVATGGERCARALAAVTADGAGAPTTARSELHTLAGEAGILGLAELAELAQAGERDSLTWAEGGDLAARARVAIAIRTLASRIRALAAAAPAPRRLIVVDDSPLIAAEVGAQLEADGWQVESAHDGAGAVRLVREFRPTVVLLDVNLPGPSLPALCAEARAAAAQPLAICLLSGAPDAELALRAREAGADGWVSKRAGLEQVAATVRAMAARA